MLRVSLRNSWYLALVLAAGCVEVPPLGEEDGDGKNTIIAADDCDALGGVAVYDPGDGSVYENGCGEGSTILAQLQGIEPAYCCSKVDPGEPCGPTSCGEGLVCCNASCGICAPPDAGCVAVFCEPEPPSCATTLCDEGTHCEMVDVVCVTEPCPPRPECVPNPGCELVDCMDDSECELVEVQCFAEPCFPVPQCVPVGG